MITELEIFNLALCQLGISPVAGLTDTSDKRVQAYRMTYDQALEYVLSDLQLSFSVKREELSLLADQTLPGFDYIYQLPGDCMIAHLVMDADGVHETGWELKRIGALSKTVIASNLADAYLEFVQMVGETSVYPAQFVECMKYKLSADMAVYLTGDQQKMAVNVKMYQDSKQLAIVVDKKQKQTTPSLPSVSTYTDARV